MRVYGGFTNYGQSIGIIMLDTHFPRIPGDIGNASTFSFPVRYRVVKGASPHRVVNEGGLSLLEPFLEAARELEGEGVRAIATSCGFLATFQQQLADAVRVPVYSSSLLQVALAKTVIHNRQKVGILTARAQSFSERHLVGAGAQHIPVAVKGMDEAPEFTAVFLDGKRDLDIALVAEEMKAAAQMLVKEHPETGALVLECTNMPPFAKIVQDAVNLPVFDAVTLVNYAFSVVVRREFSGFM